MSLISLIRSHASEQSIPLVLLYATLDPSGRKLAKTISDYAVTIEHHRLMLEAKAGLAKQSKSDQQSLNAHRLTIQSTERLHSEALLELIRKATEQQ